MQQLSHATKRTAGDPEESARALLDALPPVMWFVRRHMRKHRGAGLSVPQFRALVFIDAYPATTLSALAENLGATMPTASRIISGLVQKKLVRRTGGAKDRRKLALELTPKGRSVQQNSRRFTEKQVARILKRATGAERAAIASALQSLKALFDGSVSEPETRSGKRGS